jgi:hypothetical protein
VRTLLCFVSDGGAVHPLSAVAFERDAYDER